MEKSGADGADGADGGDTRQRDCLLTSTVLQSWHRDGVQSGLSAHVAGHLPQWKGYGVEQRWSGVWFNLQHYVVTAQTDFGRPPCISLNTFLLLLTFNQKQQRLCCPFWFGRSTVCWIILAIWRCNIRGWLGSRLCNGRAERTTCLLGSNDFCDVSICELAMHPIGRPPSPPSLPDNII